MRSNSYQSPLAYKINEAKNSTERYNCLLSCHKDAIERNAAISYAGINSLELEIPINAESIPLPDKVDFARIADGLVDIYEELLKGKKE